MKPTPTNNNVHWLDIANQHHLLHGYSIDEVEKRLAYGSFVGDHLNYVFVETPKAACSTMKWVLIDLEKRHVQPKQVGKESIAAMLIHVRASHGIKSLMRVSQEDRLRLLAQKDIVRFCVVRNPYARTVSAWADKVRQREPGYEKVWRDIAAHCNSDPLKCPSFSEFVCWLTEKQHPQRCNPHWRPMVHLLLPELLNYTHVLHTENLVAELQVVLNQIAPGQDADILLKKHRTNESLPTEWQTYYDEETASLVSSFYKEDFKQYGYPLDSWKPNTNPVSLDNEVELLRKKLQKYELAALEAIRGRNDVILELIQKNQAGAKKTVAKQKILVLGDSHAKIFEQPALQALTPRLEWKVVSVVGATLSGLQNPNSKTQAGPQFERALSQNRAKVVLLCLGEVDTGFVIWYRAERNNIKVEDAAKRAVENYYRLIEMAHQQGPVVVISTPLPTLLDNSNEGEVAKIRANINATLKQRTELTCWFNQQIAEWCRERDISYVNLDPYSIGGDGLVSDKLRHPNANDHHYNPKQYIKLLVENVLPVVRKLAFA